MIKKTLFLYLLGIVVVFAYACAPKVPPKPPKLDANQLRSLQVKDIDGELDCCYRASLFILQDEGWIIKEADRSNGIIQAESLKTKSSFGPQHDYARTAYKEVPHCYYVEYMNSGKLVLGRGKMWERWEEANVTLEPWRNNVTKIRLSLVKKGFLPQKVYSQGLIFQTTYTDPEENVTDIIDDPTVYQNFFARLQKEVFIRQNLNETDEPKQTRDNPSPGMPTGGYTPKKNSLDAIRRF